MNKKEDINDSHRRLIIGLDLISLFSKQIELYFKSLKLGLIAHMELRNTAVTQFWMCAEIPQTPPRHVTVVLYIYFYLFSF